MVKGDRLMGQGLIETGRIVNTHGVRGEVKIQPWADSPELFLQLERLFLSEDTPPLLIERCRVHKGNVIVKFRGVDSLDAAQSYKGCVVFLDRGDVPLEEGVYFVSDLIGLSVEDADTGRRYGTLSEVLSTGARDVYELTADNGKRLYIPAVPEVVIEVDLEGRRMRIRPLEGLFDAL